MNKNILMVSGDAGLAQGKKNIFYEMLREFSKYFETVHVIVGSVQEEEGRGESFVIHENVHVYPSNRSRYLRTDFWTHPSFVLQRAREIHEKFPLSAVVSHVIPPFFVGTCGAFRVAEELKIPHFAEVMHIPGYPKAQHFWELIERWSMKRFLRRNHERMSKIRIINQKELEPLLLGLGVPKEKLLHIPAFYVDFSVFKPVDSDVAAVYGGKKNPKQFVFAGRLDRNKNVFGLLEAFEILAKKDAELRLKIIGEGKLLPQVKKFIHSRNLDSQVELLGWLPSMENVAQIYRESAALVMPSFSEGGPRVCLEAMACETLVLSTPVGVMTEVLKDGENALKIAWDAKSIAEEMTWVLEHPEESERIAKAGRESVKIFEYHEAIRNYAESYLRLLS